MSTGAPGAHPATPGQRPPVPGPYPAPSGPAPGPGLASYPLSPYGPVPYDPTGFQPFVPPPPPSGPAPRYRERRPVRWWMVLAGVGGSVVWYLLIALLTRSPSSFVLMMLLGMIAAGVATWVLAWRGDRGLAVGIGAMIGVALSATVVGGAGLYLAEGLSALP